MTIGRPSKKDSTLSKDRILALALEILDEGGEKALSFRSLAKRLHVTPMAVAHHVGSRHQMLTSLVAQVYEGLAVAPEIATPKACLKVILTRYCQRVVKHPNVAQLIFADRSLFVGQVVELTNAIRKNVAALVKCTEEADTLVGLIIDYTHGFAISAAANHDESIQSPTIDDFHRGLDWILVHIPDEEN